MVGQRSAISPAAARLLASFSRQIAERLPAETSDTTADVEQQASTAGRPDSDAEPLSAPEQPRVTCSAAVLDAPILAKPAAPGGERPAWQAQRDAANELSVSESTLEMLHLQSGALVKARVHARPRALSRAP